MVHGKNPQNPNITKKILQDQLKINPLQINMKGTVRVNVQRIMKEVTDIWEAIKHIAITIAHEATHQIEREYTGTTSEIGPQKTEQDFIAWLKNNEPRLKQKYSSKIPVSQQNPV
jgi:metal-dependent amidase/aminoacylase/carboxypeptidase family protein